MPADRRPSYILFITDQQRADHLGCTGHPVLQTPNIDAMAAKGVIFDRFYVASPICMPNRASLMTCRMPSSHGVRTLGHPLGHEHVTFVDVLRAAGYDTALIGKSHLQNVSRFEVKMEPRVYREGYAAPPEELAQAIRVDRDGPTYQYERQSFWTQENPVVPTPFYGFDHYDSVTRHGTNLGGDYELWLRKTAPHVLPLRGRDTQLPHDYTCPQAVRTPIPEEYYSTTYIANQAARWLEAREGSDRPFFLMVSWPDPHHPFNPPGRFWDMYDPDQMPQPRGYDDPDWAVPDYITAAEEERASNPAAGQGMGYTIAVSEREAREARALTCGMISMVDEGVGRVRAAAEAAGLADKTVQIFTSDHGDHLGDHRLLFKGAEQYDTLNHVPFIWSDPKGESGTRTRAFGQTHDIGTTIMEHARIEAPDGMQGQALSVAGGAGREAVFIQYESQRTQPVFGKEPRAHTLLHDNWRLTVYRGECENELFDLSADPDEMVNLWSNPEYSAVRFDLLERLAQAEIDVMDRAPLPTAEA